MGDLIDRERHAGRLKPPSVAKGEDRVESSRQRDLRDYTDAVNKGYRNRNITERLKR